MAKKHELIVQQVQTDWTVANRGRLFKNGNGMAYRGHKRETFKDNIRTTMILNAIPIKYGLKKGSSDLVGIEFINLCKYMEKFKLKYNCSYCEHPEKKDCPFIVPIGCSVEIKTIAYPTLTPEQINWLNFTVLFNGSAYVAREKDDSYDLEKWEFLK